MSTQNRMKIWDALCQMKGAGAVAVSTDEATIFDCGPGATEGKLVIDVDACEVDTGDELYIVKLQGSNTADFSGSDIVDLGCVMTFGAAASLVGGSDITTGRFWAPFHNMNGGTIYRYLRVSTVVSGAAVATGIDYTAMLSK